MAKSRVVIIGGGIVGLAAAWRIGERFPDFEITVLEKEDRVAAHQTGRNSGVLHSGIYYKPGSLKAENCRLGKAAMQHFCQANDIPYDLCGKVIVAIDESELPALKNIHERGKANGVACEWIERDRLLEIEPHAAGIAAIHVPEAGIVDYARVCEKLADIIGRRGGAIELGARAAKIDFSENEVRITAGEREFAADYAINCAGLHCDRVERLSGAVPSAKIIPFRGEYFELTESAEHLCKGLIYPTPDPKFPFLGVHFTRMIHGGVECGPNAVLAFAREGYKKTDINLRDLWESLTYPGFLRLAWRHWPTGLGEMWRSFSKRAFVKSLSRLIPAIRSSDLVAAPAGVRAQAVTTAGELVDDFRIQIDRRMIHVENAPSPAATASLNIGLLIVDKLAEILS